MSGTTAIPVEMITFDEMTAEAIGQHYAQGRPLVIDGRCYLTRREVDGRSVVSLRVEAELVMFVERDASLSSFAPTYRWSPEAKCDSRAR